MTHIGPTAPSSKARALLSTSRARSFLAWFKVWLRRAVTVARWRYLPTRTFEGIARSAVRPCIAVSNVPTLSRRRASSV